MNTIQITYAEKLKKIIVIGDRVLVKPKSTEDKTKTGLYLPLGVQEKEVVQSGYIMKAGPGYPLPMPADNLDEPWKEKGEQKYIPLQAKEGDLALFLQKNAIEVFIEGEKYYIISQQSILLLEREEDINQDIYG